MGKISPVSAKYIINAGIEIEGVVDRPDVIGAIFGQTEGLLGSELELRELQRSGRIGRIEVNIDIRTGKSEGTIVIPSSLDKAETSIIAAAMEIIQRIGPCNAKIRIKNIEDIRISKRQFVVERAKEFLRTLMDSTMPDSQELADEVATSVRVMEIQTYGRDKLPAGPSIDESDELIVVEGRADVLTLLKNNFKNAIALNGTSVPQTIIDLSKKKTLTVFVDGDRGGDLIIKELINVAEIDFVTKAPDGKEVEELSKKEIHKAIRSRISVEQAKADIPTLRGDTDMGIPRPVQRNDFRLQQRRGPPRNNIRPVPVGAQRTEISSEQRKSFRQMAEDLIGTRGAYILDQKLNILGKVPITELNASLENLKDVYAVVFDGNIEPDLVRTAEKTNINCLIGMGSNVKPYGSNVALLTVANL